MIRDSLCENEEHDVYRIIVLLSPDIKAASELYGQRLYRYELHIGVTCEYVLEVCVCALPLAHTYQPPTAVGVTLRPKLTMVSWEFLGLWRHPISVGTDRNMCRGNQLLRVPGQTD
jgi:hypothetical protein